MDRDELLRMLDLSGEDAPAAPSGSVFAAATAATGATAGGPTALEIDDWGLRRGRELLAASARLGRLGLCGHAVADFHAAAFDPEPRLLPGCADRARHAFLAELLAAPDFRALHEDTALDEAASEIAAAAFAERFAAMRKDAAKGAGGGAGAGEALATAAAASAAANAAAGVGEMREAAAAFGMGPGGPGGNDPKAAAALFRRVRDDPTLRRICEEAGRLRRLARSKQAAKSARGTDDVVGVGRGGDVARLLPSELAGLADPGSELEALRRIAEGQALCREHGGREPRGRGPVVVSVDESGSMSGPKAVAAKALALALAWVANRQGRWAALVAYSGDSGERLLALPPGRWDADALAAWLSAFVGGGSSLDVPVREMPRMFADLGAPPGATDLVFVTDALCRVPDADRENFLAWKRSAGARVVSLVVDGEPGDLAALSDEAHAVRSLAADEEAVGRVLSI